MSWEAFRLTSKSPAELYDVLSPAGVDHLMRQAMAECWSTLPNGTRTMEAWRRLAREVFDRNMRVWSKIKKPSSWRSFDVMSPGSLRLSGWPIQ